MTDEYPSANPDRFEFTCKRCGELWTVGFSPRDPDDLMCRDCFEETGGRTYDLSNLASAPRRKHGTRVAFRITCSGCGKDSELDYVPKGVPMDEILCKDCMFERKGDASRWALVEEQKGREQRRSRKHEVACVTCGTVEMLPFKPHEDREYFCYNCYLEKQREEELGPPASTKDPKHDLGDNVFIRRKK